MDKECYDGAWGLLNDGLEEAIPPVYQYLSCVQFPSYTLLAKKNGRWGLLDCAGFEELPFQWDGITFAKNCVIAEERAGGESQYSIFYEGESYNYEGPPRKGGTRGLLLDRSFTPPFLENAYRRCGMESSLRVLPLDCLVEQQGCSARQKTEKLLETLPASWLDTAPENRELARLYHLTLALFRPWEASE